MPAGEWTSQICSWQWRHKATFFSTFKRMTPKSTVISTEEAARCSRACHPVDPFHQELIDSVERCLVRGADRRVHRRPGRDAFQPGTHLLRSLFRGMEGTPICHEPGGGAYLAVEAGVGAMFGGDVVDPQAFPEPARGHRAKDVAGFSGRHGAPL